MPSSFLRSCAFGISLLCFTALSAADADAACRCKRKTPGQQNITASGGGESTAMQGGGGTVCGMMNGFNAVILGDHTGGHDVEGRLLVMGDMNITNPFVTVNLKSVAPSSEYPTLVVLGDVTGNQLNIEGGEAHIAGDIENANTYQNGSETVTVGGDIPATLSNPEKFTKGTVNAGAYNDVPEMVKNFSAALAALEPTSEMTDAGMFNGVPGADGVAVLETDAASFGDIVEISVDTGGADALIINVRGENIKFAGNFLTTTPDLAESVIWNFPEATSLSIYNNHKWGSIIAPHADVVIEDINSPVNGTLIAGSLEQHGEVHIPAFKGLSAAICKDDGTENSADAAALPEAATMPAPVADEDDDTEAADAETEGTPDTETDQEEDENPFRELGTPRSIEDKLREDAEELVGSGAVPLEPSEELLNSLPGPLGR